MATKKKAGSKKGSAQKLEAAVLANDPPIVVSGGGGGAPKARGSARNNITVGFHPRGGPGLGHFQAQTNGDAAITGVQVSFPGTGVRPVTLSNLELYTIEITFITDSALKRGAAASRKGKTSGKRPAPSKRK